MKASDTGLPPNHRTAPQQQERDWLVISLILAMIAIMVTGFFALGFGLSGRIDAMSIRIDGLYELILSLKN